MRYECPCGHASGTTLLPRVEPANQDVIVGALARAFAIGSWGPGTNAILDVVHVPGVVIVPCWSCPTTWAITEAAHLCDSAYLDVTRSLNDIFSATYVHGRWDGHVLERSLTGPPHLQPNPQLRDGEPVVTWTVTIPGCVFRTTTRTPQEGQWLRDLVKDPNFTAVLSEIAGLDDVDHLLMVNDLLGD